MNIIIRSAQLITLFFASLCMADGVEGKPSWLCVTDASTGFYYENGKWSSTTFKVSEEKFLVRYLKESDGFIFKDKEHPVGAFALGSEHPEYRCKVNTPNIICNVGSGELRISTESLRFVKTYTFGYWDGNDNNENTPNIQIGRCTTV